MGESPKAFLLAGTVDKESCIHTKHPKCWDPSAELKTPREQGVGLGQLTRAYTSLGKVRFDALEEIRVKHPKYLKELTWTSIKFRPDLQIRAIVLKMKDNYEYYKKYTKDPLVFGMVSYNGGIGGLDKERRACKLSGICDPGLWYGHVEKFCLKSRAILYGKRSACDINRDYPSSVEARALKYKSIW